MLASFREADPRTSRERRFPPVSVNPRPSRFRETEAQVARRTAQDDPLLDALGIADKNTNPLRAFPPRRFARF